MAKHYSVRIQGRGEEMVYADPDVELQLDRTYCNGHRLYCGNTSGANGPALSFSKRREVIGNLCDFFNTKDAPTIFVLDERDKDRQQLEKLFAELVSQGHKITVEYDSVEKRDQVLDEMYLSILRAGKKLRINDTEISNADDYWRWKGGPHPPLQPSRAAGILSRIRRWLGRGAGR